jgi:hypothetical protein
MLTFVFLPQLHACASQISNPAADLVSEKKVGSYIQCEYVLTLEYLSMPLTFVIPLQLFGPERRWFFLGKLLLLREFVILFVSSKGLIFLLNLALELHDYALSRYASTSRQFPRLPYNSPSSKHLPHKSIDRSPRQVRYRRF